MRRLRRRGALAATVLAAALLIPVAAGAYDPAREAQNYSKIGERQRIYDTPAYQAQLTRVGDQQTAEGLRQAAADPERGFLSNLCWSHQNGCAGDARLYDWGSHRYGIVRPVLFTARDGATISGHVWATRSGPRRRPGIVITPGSVQAPEQLYWYAAQALAKDGYVVLTFDAQGQGRSDVFGEGVDRQEGVPAQTKGTPFYDGTEDALNFFLSTPSARYRPVASRTTHTSHAAKQARRVGEGRDAAYNPFWQRLDRRRVGLAGHSYGAGGVSYVGQQDRRVKAIVAWDNLCVPAGVAQTTDNLITFTTRYRDQAEGGQNFPAPCPPGGAPPVPRITKPALGISADYFLTPAPYTHDPDPRAKERASLTYSHRGVDTGQLVIRGGTHYEFSFLPNAAFGATARGIDMVTWYTTAWFDRYLKPADCTADRRLLTDRWRHDAAEAAVDSGHDGNLFSYHYRSRLDFHLRDGRRFDNEGLRGDARGLVRRDGVGPRYSYVAIDRSPDRAASRPAPCANGSTRSTMPSGEGGHRASAQRRAVMPRGGVEAGEGGMG